MRSQRSCPQPRPTDRVNILSRSVFLCFYNGEEYQPPLPFLLHKGVARPISPLQYLRSRGIRCLVAQSCLTLCNPIRLLCLWTSPGKNTGVSCHALLRGIFSTHPLNPPVLSPELAGRFFTASATWEAQLIIILRGVFVKMCFPRHIRTYVCIYHSRRLLIQPTFPHTP